MNVCTRVQLDGVITGIGRRLVYYPACDSCSGKLTILQDKVEPSAYWCKRCDETVEEKDVRYRYCLVLTVSDKSSVANVTAFGNGWDNLFGVTATTLHKILKKYSLQNTCEVVNQCFHDSISAAFVGHKFTFKFNVCLSKTIPRGSLSFKTLTDSLTHRVHKHCNNLIATNFSIAEVDCFKTVVNILESKLLFKDRKSDATVCGAHQEKLKLHHNSNSYLYGSWSNDSVSQDMYLVSLNSEGSNNSRPTQSSLVDSAYWKWEQTNEVKDEEIINDIVTHLELSKNDFFSFDADCEDDTIDNSLYNESFLSAFFSTQNEGLKDGMVLHTKDVTDDTGKNVVSATSSPDLFRSVANHTISRPDSLPMPLSAKTCKSSRSLFEDASLNSPDLFGIDYGRTPVRKMNATTDFTSPALC